MELSCSEAEAVVVTPMKGMTCGDYLADYLNDQGLGRRLLNPNTTSGCQICPYMTGAAWLRDKNLAGRSQGWQYVGIMAGFVILLYAAIFGVVELRSRQLTRLMRSNT
jgi:ABC-type multidrug transport system permease subunit